MCNHRVVVHTLGHVAAPRVAASVSRSGPSARRHGRRLERHLLGDDLVRPGSGVVAVGVLIVSIMLLNGLARQVSSPGDGRRVQQRLPDDRATAVNGRVAVGAARAAGGDYATVGGVVEQLACTRKENEERNRAVEQRPRTKPLTISKIKMLEITELGLATCVMSC